MICTAILCQCHYQSTLFTYNKFVLYSLRDLHIRHNCIERRYYDARIIWKHVSVPILS
jgi:hypothetical protein